MNNNIIACIWKLAINSDLSSLLDMAEGGEKVQKCASIANTSI